MVAEAVLEETEAGLVPEGSGWFVSALSAGDAARLRRSWRRLLRAPVRELAAVPEGRPVGFYGADETAARYNASSPEDTQDGELAYARFAPGQLSRYREGWLPGYD